MSSELVTDDEQLPLKDLICALELGVFKSNTVSKQEKKSTIKETQHIDTERKMMIRSLLRTFR